VTGRRLRRLHGTLECAFHHAISRYAIDADGGVTSGFMEVVTAALRPMLLTAGMLGSPA
jgi:hypothetical protein